ncbi:MAG: hypothetical protein Q7U57_16230 [Methylovulum sp.]|nr:hypothetical protein [Methylovulum sp.]
MKTLVLLLAFANIAFFMWKYKTGALAPHIATTEQQPAGQEPIVLLSELKTAAPDVADTGSAALDAAPAPPPAPLPEQPKAPAFRCYEVGPFTDQKDYQHWFNVMGNQYAVTPISKNEQYANRYVVSFRPGNAKEAGEFIESIKKQGVKDFFIHRTPTGQEEISLGVFSTAARAGTMQQQMRAKSINTTVNIEYKTKAQKYLLIKNDNTPLELPTNLHKAYPALTVTDTGCR